MFELKELKSTDGSWQALELDWTRRCHEHDEDFSQFAMASWPVLSECAEADMRDEGVYALEFDGETHAICRANSVLIPNYIGKVLRVRHILMSPFYDFGDVSIEKYARALSKLFVGAIHLSNIGLPSPHVKFHLRSVADRQFFSTIGDSMSELDMFSSVKLKGSWLYITKA